jgi:uncharacterized protein (DUF849 family)
MTTQDLIINFTPTGMIPTREMSPHVPIRSEEIVEDVLSAHEFGITMAHLHARDETTGEPTWHAAQYAGIISGIRKFAPDLVLCVSTSGRTFSEFEKRAAPLSLVGDLKPDMASLTLSSVNFNRQASISSPAMIRRLAEEMKHRGILPELEAFDVGMINNAKYLHKKGLLHPPHYFNLILGNIACAQADLLHLGVMIRDLPPESYWSAGGIGDSQLAVNAVAAAIGGGVRVGLEDNLWYDRNRTRLAKNVDLIRRIHHLSEANERRVMTPADFRSRLGLAPGNGRYGKETAPPETATAPRTES